MSAQQQRPRPTKGEDENVLQQGVVQEELRASQEGIPDTVKAVRESTVPRYPNWPTSRPGPLASQPGVGQRPINAQRREQMIEIGYDQTTGTPIEQDPERYWPDEDLKGRTSFDQGSTAQEQRQRGDDPTQPWSRHS